MTSDIALSGVACTSGVTPRQLVQSSSENDISGDHGERSKNDRFIDGPCKRVKVARSTIVWPMSDQTCLQRPQSRPFQIGGCPIRHSETKHAEVAKRTFRWSDNASGIRHRSTGNHSPKAIWCPVDRPVRNRLPVVLLLVLTAIFNPVVQMTAFKRPIYCALFPAICQG